MHEILANRPEIREIEAKRSEIQTSERKLLAAQEASDREFRERQDAWRQSLRPLTLAGELAPPAPLPDRTAISEQLQIGNGIRDELARQLRRVLVGLAPSVFPEIFGRERKLWAKGRKTGPDDWRPIHVELESLRATAWQIAEALDLTGKQTQPRRSARAMIPREPISENSFTEWVRRPGFESAIGKDPTKQPEQVRRTEPVEETVNPDVARELKLQEMGSPGRGTEI